MQQWGTKRTRRESERDWDPEEKAPRAWDSLLLSLLWGESDNSEGSFSFACHLLYLSLLGCPSPKRIHQYLTALTEQDFLDTQLHSVMQYMAVLHCW